jgi:hypothetical protein
VSVSIATKGLAQMTLGANKKEKQKILHDAINNITHCWNSSKIYFTYSRNTCKIDTLKRIQKLTWSGHGGRRGRDDMVD